MLAAVPGAYNLRSDEITLADIVRIDTPGRRGAQSTLDVIRTLLFESSGIINVRLMGARGDDTADDYPPIHAAVTYAKTRLGGATIVVPPGIYQLKTGEIVLDADNLAIVLQPGAVLKQMTFGWSSIQIRNADGCSVTGGGIIRNTQPKAVINGTYDDQPARQRATGVYIIEANDTVVDGITIENQVCGVTLRPTDPAATRLQNNVVRNVLCKRVDYGFLPQAQRNMVCDNLIGLTTENSQPTAPPHLIYVTFADALDLKSENVTFSNCVDYDNPFSSSFKIKHATGVSAVNMQSRKAARGFDINCDYLTLVTPQVHELVDIGDSQQGGIVLDECTYCEIIDPIVVLPDDNDTLESLTARDTCSDLTVRGGRFVSKRTAAAANGPVRVQGTRIKLIDVAFEEKGANKFPIQVEATAVDCQLIRPLVSVAVGTRILSVLAGATGTKVEIAPALLNFTYGTTTSLSDAGTGTTVSFSGRLPSSTLANLPSAATHPQAQIFASNAVGNKNPVTSDGAVWRYPDGVAV